MYRAKSRGKARYDVYDDELHANTEARRELETAMRDGLKNNLISMVFQPVIEVDTGLVVGAEALMRARDSHGRMLPTLPCVLAAEAAGLSDALSTRVLFLALRAASSWPDALHVAVNISARELTSPGLRGRVERALAEHDVAADRLVLEITETALLAAGPSALRELDRIRSLGVRIAIDDFGTAYATLANLTTLPVDVLKVDASFTAGLPDQPVHTAIVHGVASMAFELGIPCVVEGVETKAQVDALRGMTVYAQGWYWGQPVAEGVIPSVPAVPAPRGLSDRPTRVDGV